MDRRHGTKTFLFLLGITLVASANEEIVGSAAGDTTNLGVVQDIGWGRDAQVNEFPFVVLVKPGSGRPSCTGTLIQPKFVLTAVRCVSNAQDTFPPRVQVLAGNVTRGIGVVRVVKRVLLFQKPVAEELHLVSSDAAVLELFVPFPLSTAIQTVRFVNRDARVSPRDWNNKPTMNGTMVGWGLNQLGELPPKLRTAQTRFTEPISNDPTKQYLFGYFTDGASSPGNTGTLFEGDGGAPLLTKQNGQYVQWGVGVQVTSTDGLRYFHSFVDLRFWHTVMMNEIKGSPVLYTDMAFVSPNSSITVTYNKLTGRTDTAWIGLIPASVTSTLEGPNDDQHVTFCPYYIGSPTGSCLLKVPPTTSAGKYKVRAFSSDKRDGVRIGNEVDITVEKNVPNWKNYKVSHGGRVLGVQNGRDHLTTPIVAHLGLVLLLLTPIVFFVCWTRHKKHLMNDDSLWQYESV